MTGNKENLGILLGPHTDKPGALCGWVRSYVAGKIEVSLWMVRGI